MSVYRVSYEMVTFLYLVKPFLKSLRSSPFLIHDLKLFYLLYDVSKRIGHIPTYLPQISLSFHSTSLLHSIHVFKKKLMNKGIGVMATKIYETLLYGFYTTVILQFVCDEALDINIANIYRSKVIPIKI
mmetsp:Transcript_9692/g.13716  ORF Transcript_9692/g.13716 Transcript_9692/m.13716 type:complete len:129 (+) Transcript_9692:61-447(+)